MGLTTFLGETIVISKQRGCIVYVFIVHQTKQDRIE